jgi:serine/threonine protein kinase
MAATSHPNLAVLHGLETWRGAPLLVMEFLDGGTLADRLTRGPLPLGETLTLGINLASALAALHDVGILHRDIKPSNIGFTAHGVPKLLDFGLAKLVAVAQPNAASAAVAEGSTWSVTISTGLAGIRGTPAYLSPSVLSGEPPAVVDDLWSLSVTLLETCTGNNPFRAATPAATVARILTDSDRVLETAASLPHPVRDLFADLLVSRDRRPHTAHQFGQRLMDSRIIGGSNADTRSQ